MFLLEDLLKEFKYDMKIRNLTPRTIKTSYNSTVKFLKYYENKLKIIELEEIIHLHIK
ncbi:hypothetical protein [Clostridium baratii]|uniref:Uncharacterized protein n=1 Tax=Clostridium baratii TaxID=1561 RepID=A0A174PQ13_9CLOT|nr:hypothetical protein [Clostridium baratii]CUP63112.1 Uncharacterised protein [Clostridium baratii]